MSMPSFTATAALYQSRQSYYGSSFAEGGGGIVPQQLAASRGLAGFGFCDYACRCCIFWGSYRCCLVCYWCLRGPVLGGALQ
ncbi:hypothetical protein J2Z50_003178 [Ensifer mexicanus]|nr:hypothetical protein [Sinorhizobium mexicanum]